MPFSAASWYSNPILIVIGLTSEVTTLGGSLRSDRSEILSISAMIYKTKRCGNLKKQTNYNASATPQRTRVQWISNMPELKIRTRIASCCTDTSLIIDSVKQAQVRGTNNWARLSSTRTAAQWFPLRSQSIQRFAECCRRSWSRPRHDGFTS